MQALPVATKLRELAVLFLKLGVTAFGGPAAHIALMQHELVERRRWLTRGQFLDLIGAANLIPGPNSTEVAIHVGRLRAGSPGLIVAGAAFILPAFVIVTAIGMAYQRLGRLPETAALLHGVKPVIMVIVVQALIRLGRTAMPNVPSALAGGLAVVASLTGAVDEVAILAAFGIGAGLLARWRSSDGRATALSLTLPIGMTAGAGIIPGGVVLPIALWPMFVVFAKAGALMFGSGYVLFAFLQADLVERLGWLTNSQLLDAIVVGQVTPGPVSTTATFIGYTLAGLPGAIVATIGMFLPAFVFVAVSGPLIASMRQSRIAGAVLDGVNIASLGLMTAVTIVLGQNALTDASAIAIATLSAFVLFRYRPNAMILIAAGAVIGLLLH